MNVRAEKSATRVRPAFADTGGQLHNPGTLVIAMKQKEA
jgi:hypothetical protein